MGGKFREWRMRGFEREVQRKERERGGGRDRAMREREFGREVQGKEREGRREG